MCHLPRSVFGQDVTTGAAAFTAEFIDGTKPLMT
jgi:hypothetical protein